MWACREMANPDFEYRCPQDLHGQAAPSGRHWAFNPSSSFLKDHMTLKRFMVKIPSWYVSRIWHMAPILWFI